MTLSFRVDGTETTGTARCDQCGTSAEWTWDAEPAFPLAATRLQALRAGWREIRSQGPHAPTHLCPGCAEPQREMAV